MSTHPAVPSTSYRIYDQAGQPTSHWREDTTSIFGVCRDCDGDIACVGRDAEWYHVESPSRRFAVVKSNSPLETVKRYLPANYSALDVGEQTFIVGHDNAGWTLDDYVIPRLASGLHTAVEISAEEFNAAVTAEVRL